MALPSFCRETVTVYRAPMKSERGTEVRDWANQTTHTVSRCSIQPNSSSTDMSEARTATNIYATGYFAPEANIAKGDIIEWHGIKFLVNGMPMEIVSATGAVSHLRVNLVEWEG